MPNKTILIIDDEEEACELIKSFLEVRNYSVITVLSGTEGLNIIKNKNPALVFLDMHMPPLDGMGVLTELKKNNIKSNIILMTGLEDSEELDKAKTFDIKGIIKKPVQLLELLRIVKENIQ